MLGPWPEVELVDQININIVNSLSKQITDSHLFCDITSCYIITKVLKRITLQSMPVTTSGFSQDDTNSLKGLEKQPHCNKNLPKKNKKPDCCDKFTLVYCNNKMKCNTVGGKSNFPKCMLMKNCTYYGFVYTC